MNETSFVNVEGENLVIMLQATAQPATITYTWIKNGEPLPRIDGPVLNFTRLDRKDTGFYSCEANNMEGSSTINFTVTVQCKLLEISFKFGPCDDDFSSGLRKYLKNYTISDIRTTALYNCVEFTGGKVGFI